jgi:starvation-inducible outer membrane lipoprotein
MNEHPSILRHLTTACLVLAACVALGGCSVVPTGKKWWNPTTWFSAHALTSQQAAQVREDKAVAAVDQKRDEAVHSAHLEVAKAGVVLGKAAPSPDTALAGRFVQGGLGLLGQVDPLTASESSQLIALVNDLRSGDAAKIAAAEKRQAAIEAANSELSERINLLEQKLADAQAATRKKDHDLAAAFIRENEMADALRNQRFLIVGAGVLVVGLTILSLYLRMGLGSVGAGLSGLHKLIGQDAASKVVTQLDANTDWLHQVLVGAGRKAADAARAKTLSDSAHTS